MPGTDRPIEVDQIDERTTGAGVTIDGVLLQDGEVALAALSQVLDASNDVELEHLGSIDTDEDGQVDAADVADQVEAPTGIYIKSADPGSQTYTAGTTTTIATYDAGSTGILLPLRFAPADPTDAGLSVNLVAEFHDASTDQLATEAGGAVYAMEDLLANLAAGSDGKEIRKLLVQVENTTGADITEDVGATTVNFQGLARGTGSLTVS